MDRPFHVDHGNAEIIMEISKVISLLSVAFFSFYDNTKYYLWNNIQVYIIDVFNTYVDV